MSEIAIYKQLSIVNGNDLRFGFSNRPRQLATRLVGGALQGCQRIESGARRDISFFYLADYHNVHNSSAPWPSLGTLAQDM